MATLTPSISDLRQLVGAPLAASLPSPRNLVMGEIPRMPEGANAASCTLFYLANRPIVAGSVYITQGSTFRTQSGFTVDNVNGLLTFSVAPNNPSPFLVDYNYDWFVDADYTLFLTQGLRELGFPSTSTVDETIADALYEFSKAFFYKARATQYAEKYAASGGGQSEQVQTVCQEYRDLADQSYKAGLAMRDAYYERKGQKLAPSSHFWNYGLSRGGPRR